MTEPTPPTPPTPNPPAPDHTDRTGSTGSTAASASDETGKTGKKRGRLTGLPESVRLLILLWAGALAGEALHQILNVVMSLIDPSALLAAARETVDTEQAPEVADALITTSAYSAVVVAAVIAVAIVGLLAWMLTLIRKRSRHAPMARRLLLIFGFYFGIRTLMLFMVSPGASDVPLALYLFDGSLQILIGVAAVLALIFGARRETLQWTGELNDPDGSARPGRPPNDRK
ncbi:hypothetical protein [Corynebacterium halotolerans]|uniref:Uncharacterized protein n=1 Tax=Corynebacterium halotolerans YIM 70093 = DSM 44683 TaxID=1121362 RepID=M1P453_9CORY|nr:hypothetical protein [Corynebacterium halotolerans]AGF71426.1 hypothetical protein A605_02060 [Corynebacterium halotolerans YIM 70093 = DSM 44683]